MLICVIKELVEEKLRALNSETVLTRSGDDIFVGDKKISVSIATKSLTSVLIHVGLNIDSEGAPVKAAGLESDLGILDINGFAKEVMIKYSQEIDDIILASTKVVGR